VQRKAGLLADTEGAVLNRLVDVPSRGRDPVPADRIEQDELVAGIEAHVPPDIQVERGAAVVGVDRDRPTGTQDGQIKLRIRARGDLDHEIDAVPGNTADRLGRVRLRVRDDVVRAGRRREPGLRLPAAVAITCAPAQRASWTAALPTAPAPPATRIVLPSRAPGRSRDGPSSATVSARWAVTAGMPMLAPSSNSAPAGSRKARSAGTTVNSCAVPPAGRPSPASVTHTRSPALNPLTPAPTSSTTPAPSWLGTVAFVRVPPNAPLRDFQSVGLTPDTRTRIRISPFPGSGTGLSTSSSTDGSPGRVYVIALMSARDLPCGSPWRSSHTG
jgi:hypothetical protein